MSKAEILILGSAGQLGQAISAVLTDAQIVFCAKTREQLDICDHAALQQQLQQLQPSVIINCAAYTAVDLAESNAQMCQAINSTAVATLADYCASTQTLLIHFSTDYIFDGKKPLPYTENDKPNPLNQYGVSKLAGEQAIQQRHAPHYIIRTSWLYSEHGKNFYVTLCALSKQAKAVRVVSDQIGAPTKAKDLAEVLCKIIQQRNTSNALPLGIYHYCGNVYQSWYEFAQQIFVQQQSQTPLIAITAAEYAAAAKRPANSCLNSDLLKHWLAQLPTKEQVSN